MFDLNLKDKLYTTIALVVVAIAIVLAAGSLITNYFNQDTVNHNVAVAVKAKEDLKNAIELNNKAQEEIVKLNAEIQERARIDNEFKVLEEENNKFTNEAVENIKTIDSTKIVYIEKPEDIAKSKIIIDEIWNTYNKERKEKLNENINNTNK